jgi:hypothetical protein
MHENLRLIEPCVPLDNVAQAPPFIAKKRALGASRP